MGPSKLYPLRSIEKRRVNKHIIITQVSNFSLRTNPLTPELEGYVPYYAYRRVFNYFRENQELHQVPFHFYVNEIQNDWEVFNAAPLNYRSPWLGSLIDNFYIDSFYQDAIVIAIQDDFSLRIPDERMYSVLASRVIAPLLQTLRMGTYIDCVHWLEDIFDYKRYSQKLIDDYLNYDYPYKYKQRTYFDPVAFKQQLKKFCV
jgi:hypothetical protein